jgi:hypothetical protein
MAFLSYINIGIIIFIINFNLEWAQIGSLPFFDGQYGHFTVDWYRSIGSTICITLLFMCFSPHIENLCF